MTKGIFKLLAVFALCFAMTSCYWDEVAYVGGRPYLIVDYPVQTVVVRSQPVVVSRPAPPPHRPMRGGVRGGRR